MLSVCPRGARIVAARSSKERRAELAPIRVRLELTGGAQHTVYLRLDRTPHGVEREARLLPLLRRLELPVAEVLVGPVVDPEMPDLGAMAVYSVLPGKNLLEWSWSTSLTSQPEATHALADQLLDGIERLRALGPAVASDRVGAALPRGSLTWEIDYALKDASLTFPDDPWQGQPHLRETMNLLRPLLERAEHETPPCSFWNGDFNPANFLSDGTKLTGIVDFAWASWHDPHYGLARFTIYDWVRFDRPRLFQRYREHHALSARDFALRSAVHAFTTLLGGPHAPVTPEQRLVIQAQLDAHLNLIHGGPP